MVVTDGQVEREKASLGSGSGSREGTEVGAAKGRTVWSIQSLGVEFTALGRRVRTM